MFCAIQNCHIVSHEYQEIVEERCSVVLQNMEEKGLESKSQEFWTNLAISAIIKLEIDKKHLTEVTQLKSLLKKQAKRKWELLWQKQKENESNISLNFRDDLMRSLFEMKHTTNNQQ